MCFNSLFILFSSPQLCFWSCRKLTHTLFLSLSPSHTRTHTQVGVVEDNDNRKDIGEFVCFQSTADATKLTTIGQYIERMKEGQTCVYFVSGEGRAQVCTG